MGFHLGNMQVIPVEAEDSNNWNLPESQEQKQNGGQFLGLNGYCQ